MLKKIILIVLVAAVFLGGWTYFDYRLAAEAPTVDYIDLSSVLEKETLTDEDFNLIFSQTGLGKPAVSALMETEDFAEEIKAFQKQKLAPFSYKQTFIFFPTTTAEQLYDEAENPRVLRLPPLQAGDILVTRSTKTLLYRHGHAGLVLDEEGHTLESLMIGSDSMVLSTDYWHSYPTLMILHPKNLSCDEKQAIADFGRERMLGIPYNLLTGILKKDKQEMETIDGTHCSHLVWQCYKNAGIDLDSDGGFLVSPHDIANSGELELVFSFGFGETGTW